MSIGIYIHIPFCVRKCHYCDFLSEPASPALQRKYMTALRREIDMRVEKVETAHSIYIGGGTPSILKPELWEELLWVCQQKFKLKRNYEWTVEINPGVLDEQILPLLFEAGVNRLSFGVQSLDNHTLNTLGRVHQYQDVLHSIHCARQIGFQNINLDFIYGLPNMTLYQWQETLKQAVDLSPEHLSLYGLIIEEGTKLADDIRYNRLPSPDEDIAADCYEWQQDFLQLNGYEQYEISNYAKTDRESRHNIGYWRLMPWLGFGLGASSYKDGILSRNIWQMEEYFDRCAKMETAIAEEAHWNLEEIMSETMIMGLRMNVGVNLLEFQEKFGKNLMELWQEEIKKGIHLELMEIVDGNLRLSKRGRLLGNEVFTWFL